MTAARPQPGQPVVFRNGTVLTMDDSHTVLTGADVQAAFRKWIRPDDMVRVVRGPTPP